MNVISLFDGISCGMVALERERESLLKNMLRLKLMRTQLQ